MRSTAREHNYRKTKSSSAAAEKKETDSKVLCVPLCQPLSALCQIEILNSPIGRIDISYLVIPMVKINSTNE